MERRGEMRAADADRQLVAERLPLAVDEGRLDLYEYGRLRAAYAAKTYAELDRLLDDLPEPVPVRRAEMVPWDSVLLASTVSGLAQGQPQRARKKAAKRARSEQRERGADPKSPESDRAVRPQPGEPEGWQLGRKAD